MNRPFTRFKVGSSVLGEREDVHVHIYPTLDAMRAAGATFNGSDLAEALAVTQAWTDDDHRTTGIVVRLTDGHLGTRILSHEIYHAATAIYGAHVGNRISRRAHLNHYNEPFAHLYSDLLHGAVAKLYKLGAYT